MTLELAGHRIDFLRLQGKTTDALALAAHHVDDAGKSPELLRNIAYLYAICRRYAAARELLDKHSSDSDSVLATKILIRIIEGDFEDALRVAEGVKVASAAVLGLKAWLLAYQAKFDEAHALLDHAETLNIDSTPKTVRVEVLLMEGKLDKALEKARAAFAELPRNLDVLLNLAQIHLARNERKEALEFARLASSRDASLTSPVQIETLALLRDGRRHEALMTVERAIERFGRTSGLLQCRGYVRLLTEETMTFAQRDFMEALVEPRPGLIARTGLGAIAYRRREYDEAEKRFTEIMNLQPFSLDAKTNLAWTYVAGGNVAKMEQAEKLCMGVLERDESNARALGCLGALAYRRGERRKAESVLRLAAPDDEKSDIENLVNRGAAEAKLGKYDAAAASLAAALKRNPNHARALVEQSTLQLKRGLTKESRESAQASVDANGHVAATWRALAAAALAQKEEKEAELILRRALAHVDTAERADVEIDLARLLVNAADARSGDPRLRDAIEMLTRVLDAGGPSEANLLYGVAQLKLGDASAALSALDKAKNDERLVGHVTSLRRIAADMKRSAMASSVSQWGLAAVVMINMIALWIWVIADPSKSGGFQVLLPITLALLIIAVVLPRLVSLKVVAVEAQLAVAPREIRPEALVGPAAEIDMQPALDPLVGALAYDL
ncbi:MAG TPA: tetratricopeptide repeat protein [Thermoanaerobaculia bacterium]|nr:tetratricopeptide repeat protein [Thermoanaerobaculia bacterium]